MALADIFYERFARTLGETAGRRALAVGKHGSRLERMASECSFTAFLPLPTDAPAHFGLHGPAGILPGLWLGVDCDGLLSAADQAGDLSSDHPSLTLAALTAAVAESGWAQLAWCSSPSLHPLGAWVQQLMARATGKAGRGIVVVSPTCPPEPTHVRSHTLFLSPRFPDEDTSTLDLALGALQAAGHPVVRWPLRRTDLGGAFTTLELATALLALLLGVNPFSEEKEQGRRPGSLFRLPTPPWDAPTLRKGLRAHLAAHPNATAVALVAYLPEHAETRHALAQLAARLEQWSGAPVIFGFGPRFTLAFRQLLTEGPAGIVSVVLTANSEKRLAIPGRQVTLDDLWRAYASHDLRALVEAGRTPLHFHLGDEPVAGLRQLAL